MADGDSISELTHFWTQLCSNLNIPTDTTGDKWLLYVRSQYERPYYDLSYLTYKLKQYEVCKQTLKEPNAVFLALIFQSVHYVTNATDNLEKCLTTFQEFAVETGLNEGHSEIVNRVSTLIEISVSNSSSEFWEDGTFGQEDSHYFLDINFAHLAQDWTEYKIFSEKTRHEYDTLNAESYAKLRRKVLQSFLHIPNIFATAQFRNQFEEKARRNIQKEIDELS